MMPFDRENSLSGTERKFVGPWACEHLMYVFLFLWLLNPKMINPPLSCSNSPRNCCRSRTKVIIGLGFGKKKLSADLCNLKQTIQRLVFLSNVKKREYRH